MSEKPAFPLQHDAATDTVHLEYIDIHELSSALESAWDSEFTCMQIGGYVRLRRDPLRFHAVPGASAGVSRTRPPPGFIWGSGAGGRGGYGCVNARMRRIGLLYLSSE